MWPPPFLARVSDVTIVQLGGALGSQSSMSTPVLAGIIIGAVAAFLGVPIAMAAYYYTRARVPRVGLPSAPASEQPPTDPHKDAPHDPSPGAHVPSAQAEPTPADQDPSSVPEQSKEDCTTDDATVIDLGVSPLKGNIEAVAFPPTSV
jgi:hypothetical protein